jgi:hypothetical protein
VNLKAGDKIKFIEDESCLSANKVYVVHDSYGGLHVKCEGGAHYIEGCYELGKHIVRAEPLTAVEQYIARELRVDGEPT